MTIERIVEPDGSIHDKIKLTDEENTEIDRCHDILRLRFQQRGEEYTAEQQKMCEWWLQGILRFEGVKKMVCMAENAPFHEQKKLVACGYAEVKESCEI